MGKHGATHESDEEDFRMMYDLTANSSTAVRNSPCGGTLANGGQNVRTSMSGMFSSGRTDARHMAEHTGPYALSDPECEGLVRLYPSSRPRPPVGLQKPYPWMERLHPIIGESTLVKRLPDVIPGNEASHRERMKMERKALYELLKWPNPDEYPWPGAPEFIDPYCRNNDPEKGPMNCDVWIHSIKLACLDTPMGICCRHTRYTPAWGSWNPTGGYPELTEFPIIPKVERWQDIDDVSTSYGIMYCPSCESNKGTDDFMLVDHASVTTMGDNPTAAASSGPQPSATNQSVKEEQLPDVEDSDVRTFVVVVELEIERIDLWRKTAGLTTASIATVEAVARKLGSTFQEEHTSCGVDATIMNHCRSRSMRPFQTLMENITQIGQKKFIGTKMRGHAEGTNQGQCSRLDLRGRFHDSKGSMP
eukprot:6490860-Amphidinium_carterae.1